MHGRIQDGDGSASESVSSGRNGPVVPTRGWKTVSDNVRGLMRHQESTTSNLIGCPDDPLQPPPVCFSAGSSFLGVYSIFRHKL